MWMPGVTQGIEDRRERTDGDNDSEQNGRGAERLAASDIEAGSGEYVEIGGQALLHEWVTLGLCRRGPGWRRSGEVGHTDSVNALLKGWRERLTGLATGAAPRLAYESSCQSPDGQTSMTTMKAAMMDPDTC